MTIGELTAEGLWESFADRYQHWTVEDFKTLDDHTQLLLRTTLRKNGVYIHKKMRYSKAKALYETAQLEEAPLDWPNDDTEYPQYLGPTLPTVSHIAVIAYDQTEALEGVD